MITITARRGRKVGGQCRSSILKTRTGPRRVFADAAEVAALADLKNKKGHAPMQLRPKATIFWTEANGHRVVEVRRPLPVMQILKARR